MTDHTNEARMAMRRKFHEAVASREVMFVKLRPLRAQQQRIRDHVATLNAEEQTIVDQIKAIEADLAPVQHDMSSATAALQAIDGTPHPSVGLAPDGRDPVA